MVAAPQYLSSVLTRLSSRTRTLMDSSLLSRVLVRLHSLTALTHGNRSDCCSIQAMATGLS